MSRHLVLVVEDEPDTAGCIADILASIGIDHELVTNLAEALPLVRSGRFCCLIQDLQILPDKKAPKPSPQTGMTLLESSRSEFPGEVGGGNYWWPILVMSGHAKEPKWIRSAFRHKADDFIEKPFDEATLADAVREALRRSRRHRHADCEAATLRARRGSAGKRVGSAAKHRIRLIGNPVRRRMSVHVDGTPVSVKPSSFRILLRLAAARLQEEAAARAGTPSSPVWINRIDLGATTDHGWKGPSDLREALRGHLTVDPLTYDDSGGWRLADEVEIEIEREDLSRLVRHDMEIIREAASAAEKWLQK